MELNPYILPPELFMDRFKQLNPELWHEWELKWVKQDIRKLEIYNDWRKNLPTNRKDSTILDICQEGCARWDLNP